jgi:hypothetical protein
VGLVAVFTQGTSRAIVTGSPSNFESSDGNMTVQTAGNTDWNCFANGNSSGFASGITVGQACASPLDFAEAAARPADQNGEIQLANGSKFDDQNPGLSTGNNPPKDEFQATAEFTDQNTATPPHTFFYGASIRPNTNGNASGNLELNQIAGDGTTTHGMRSSGDRLIQYDFTNGGTNLSFQVLTYIISSTDTAGGNNTGTTTGCFSGNSAKPPCWGKKVIIPDSTEFEGAVNTTGPIPANENGINGAALDKFAFNELGVDLTRVLGLTGCFSFPQQVWESRSSGSSFTSNPQDLEFQTIPIQNCGEIVIQKHTSPRGLNQAFSFNSDITGSQLKAGTGSGVTGAACREAAAGFTNPYTLNDTGNTTGGDSPGNTNDCTNVVQGTYHVSEVNQPGGFTFKGVNCTADATSGSSASTTPGGTATIVLKPFGLVTCIYTNQQNTASLATQVSTAASVFPGQPVHDTATVTGNQAADIPSGTVTFSLCGPTPTDAGCSTDGTPAGTGMLSATGNPGQASANSPDVNTTGSPLGAGHYCFRASWPGDTNYPAPLTEFGGSSGTNECFTVRTITTKTHTTPSVGSGGTATFGSSVTDHALVTADLPDGGPLTGSVTFFVCDPTQTSGGACPDPNGTLVGPPTGVPTVDLGTNPASATADSAGVTANKLGTWCFRAVYTPSTANYTGSSDATPGECFIVKDTTKSSSAQSWVPNDAASASSVNGAPLNGTLTVQLYTGTGCTNGNQVSGHVYQKTVSGNTTLATVSLTTTNSDVFNSDVSWLVTFSSTDGNVSNPPDHCESSSLTVNN